MLSLKSRQDGFRFLLPNEFIPDEINDKYAKILQEKKGFFVKPIDYLNESIQKLQVLGFNNATKIQRQFTREKLTDYNNFKSTNNKIQPNGSSRYFTAADVAYRNEVSPLDIIDKTLNVDFRHDIGYLNYFLLFETFWWQYYRHKQYLDLPHQFNIDLLDEHGCVYARVVLYDPIIDGIDMLNLDYTQPIASNAEFRVVWKYSNIDFQFLLEDENNSDNS